MFQLKYIFSKGHLHVINSWALNYSYVRDFWFFPLAQRPSFLCVLNVFVTFGNKIWTVMAVRVVEFSNGGTKLDRFLPKNQHTQRKLLNFENYLSQFFFQWKITIWGTFFVIDIFWYHHFSNHIITKVMPNFSQLAATPIFKIHEFPLGMSIFRQKSS